jgi:hypothetical protein
MTTIKLNKATQPYYVDQFAAPGQCGDTVKWEAEDGEFSITIRDAYKFFAIPDSTKKFSINSIGAKKDQTLTIRSGLAINTEKWYDVFCVAPPDAADAPPRIIIVPPST